MSGFLYPSLAFFLLVTLTIIVLYFAGAFSGKKKSEENGNAGDEDNHVNGERFPLNPTSREFIDQYSDFVVDTYGNKWRVSNNHASTADYRASYLFLPGNTGDSSCTLNSPLVCDTYKTGANYCTFKPQAIAEIPDCSTGEYYYEEIRLESENLKKYSLTQMSFDYANLPNYDDYDYYPCAWVLQGRNNTSSPMGMSVQGQETWTTLQNIQVGTTYIPVPAGFPGPSVKVSWEGLQAYNSYRIVFYQSYDSKSGSKGVGAAITNLKFFGKPHSSSVIHSKWLYHTENKKRKNKFISSRVHTRNKAR